MSEEQREIEIIPPGEDPIGGPASRLWVSHGQGQVRIVKLGPFGGFMVGLGLLSLFGLGFFFLTSMFLILTPIVAVLGAGAYLSGLFGAGPFKRLR